MKKREKEDAVRKILSDLTPSPTDPQGSWTGLPENEADTPVQDADDL